MPLQPGQPDELTRPHREIPDRQHDIPDGTRRALRRMLGQLISARHQPHQLLHRRLAPGDRRDGLPRAHDRDPVTDLLDLIHPVGDEDHRHPIRGQRLQHREQPIPRRHVQGRGRLIEDDHPRITHQRPRNPTRLAITQRQLLHGLIQRRAHTQQRGQHLRHPAGEARTPSDFIRALADRDTPRLSTATTPGSEGAALIAASRATTPERLRRTLHGDLDTILAKALKKAPAERYASVSEFADDLRRFVEQKPISARPETMRYRTAKFARRHWQGLVIGLAALILIVATASYYTIELAAERDRARIEADKASKVSDLMTRLITGVDPYRMPDARAPSIANLLASGADSVTRELVDQPQVQTELLNTIGRTYQRLGMNDKAQPILEQALAIGRRALGPNDVRIAQSLNDLGVLLRAVGNPEAALRLLTESLAMRRLLLGSNHRDVAVTLVEQSRVLSDLGQLSESTAPALEALEIRRRIFGEEHGETATSKSEVARIWLQRGDLDRAEKLYREALETNRRVRGDDHPNVAASKANVAQVLIARGPSEEAERLVRESLATDQKVFGKESVDAAMSVNNLALVLEVEGRLAESAAMFDEALRIATPQLRADHPRVLAWRLNAARVRIALGNAAGTDALLQHVLELRQRTLRAGDWRIAQAQSVLASSLLAQGRIAEARPLMDSADQILKPVPGVQGREYAANHARLSSLAGRSRSSK